MRPERNLHQLQHWFQAGIIDPGSIQEAAARAFLRPGRSLSACERLGIYQQIYRLRMSEVLEHDYPALARLLGTEAFERLVQGYLRAAPSQSHSLNYLGARLPEYIMQAEDFPGRGRAYDLARLELAVTEVFDAAETRPLDIVTIAALPGEAWAQARLRPIAALRLISCDYDLNGFLSAVYDNDRQAEPESICARKSWLIVYRRDYQLHRVPLVPAEFHLLHQLSCGVRLGQAINSVAEILADEASALIARWLEHWLAEGIFQAIRGWDGHAENQ